MKHNHHTTGSNRVFKGLMAAIPFALCLAGTPVLAEDHRDNRGHNWQDFGYSDSNYRDDNRRSGYRDHNRGSDYRDYYEGSDRSYRQSGNDDNRNARARDSRGYYDRSEYWSEGYDHPGYRDPDDYNYNRNYDRNYDSDYVYEYDAYDYDDDRGDYYDMFDDNERAHREWYGGYDDAGDEGILDW